MRGRCHLWFVQPLRKEVTRMGLEGHDATGHTTVTRFTVAQQGQHGLVATVHPIKVANGQGAGLGELGVVETSENTHGDSQEGQRSVIENKVYCLGIDVSARFLSLRRCQLKVLKLSAQGLPQSWISLEQAVIHYAADEVRWEAGAQIAVFRGGHNAITGQQSIITVNSIIGTKGVPSHQPL